MSRWSYGDCDISINSPVYLSQATGHQCKTWSLYVCQLWRKMIIHAIVMAEDDSVTNTLGLAAEVEHMSTSQLPEGDGDLVHRHPRHWAKQPRTGSASARAWNCNIQVGILSVRQPNCSGRWPITYWAFRSQKDRCACVNSRYPKWSAIGSRATTKICTDKMTKIWKRTVSTALLWERGTALRYWYGTLVENESFSKAEKWAIVESQEPIDW